MSKQDNIQHLIENQTTYLPKQEVLEHLKTVSALLFVGPAGVGKSTILDTITELDDRFGRTGSIGTRPLAERDKAGLYKQLPLGDIAKAIAEKEIVQYAVHPTTGMLYATKKEMYLKPHNMLEALPVAVEHFRRLPFRDTPIFYVVTEPNAWKNWFTSRYIVKDAERKKRAEEAIQSLTWALEQPPETINWVKNVPGKIQNSAKRCIQLVLKEVSSDNHRAEARAMLAIARTLL